ncbi:hypothetical protein BC628DRAFT_1323291 [Trametes gibbosa]|nr:hypothetical protein BC628DRAFT_1323291 [Trametes gibbosa]
MSFCDKPTILRFVRTCHTIHRSGLKFILGGQVCINNQRSLDSFICFLAARSANVLSHIRSLHIAVGAIIPTHASLIASVLKCCQNLHSLYISQTREFLASHPDLFDALSSMSSLRHLSLYRAGKLGLLGSASWLVSLKVTYINPDPFFDALNDEEGIMHHPMILCAPLQFKLEELEIEFSRRYGALIYHAPYVFSKVKRLTLYDNAPYIKAYLTAFPNLTHLTITSDHRPWADLDHFTEDFEEHRQFNCAAQEVGSSWSHLESLTADVCALYLLAPSCHVGRLTVMPVDAAVQLRLLCSVLRDIRPTELHMTVNMEVLAALPGLFFQVAPELVGTLSSLSLAVAVSPLGAGTNRNSVSRTMRELINELRPCRLQSFELHFYALPSPDFGGGPAARSEPAGNTHLSATTEDESAVVFTGVQTLPTQPRPAGLCDIFLARFHLQAVGALLATCWPSLKHGRIHITPSSRQFKQRTVLVRRDEGGQGFVACQ